MKKKWKATLPFYLDDTYCPTFEVLCVAHEVKGAIYKYKLLENSFQVL